MALGPYVSYKRGKSDFWGNFFALLQFPIPIIRHIKYLVCKRLKSNSVYKYKYMKLMQFHQNWYTIEEFKDAKAKCSCSSDAKFMWIKSSVFLWVCTSNFVKICPAKSMMIHVDEQTKYPTQFFVKAPKAVINKNYYTNK